jgi:nucleotide-binding universal stress UspA family protein
MLKTALVHVTGTPADKNTLAAAHALLQPSGHLECLHVRPDLGLLLDQAKLSTVDGYSLQRMLDDLERASAAASERAAATTAEFGAAAKLTRCDEPPQPGTMNFRFREVVGIPIDQLIVSSREHDLVVVSRHEESGGLSREDLSQLIVAAGRPILLVPTAPAQPIRTIAIAWKDTPEAARAVAVAVPLLPPARKVHVLSAEENGQPSDSDAVVRYLAWHNMSAEAHEVRLGKRLPPHAVLEDARGLEADLLVMGAYSRSRVTELVFGSFTTAVIEDASLPVLMVH